jgi:hypothetical protein
LYNPPEESTSFESFIEMVPLVKARVPSGPNIIKLFTAVDYKCQYWAGEIVNANLFWNIIKFTGLSIYNRMTRHIFVS